LKCSLADLTAMLSLILASLWQIRKPFFPIPVTAGRLS